MKRNSDELTNSKPSDCLRRRKEKAFKIHNDLKLIPVKKIKEQLPKFLEKLNPEFIPFKEAILNYSQANANKDEYLFKEGVLQFVKSHPVDAQN
ncbi:MAG: hypothetical protein IPO06_25640 [Leptospiraceae bacterium]|nr:hypothetical protein [Leptospiraceae bacterium]